MKRWIVLLLIAVFCVHALPVLKLSELACVLVADAADAEDDAGAEDPFCLKKEISPKWCAVPATQGFFIRLHFDRRVHAALHDAVKPASLFSGEVPTPPPNCC